MSLYLDFYVKQGSRNITEQESSVRRSWLPQPNFLQQLRSGRFCRNCGGSLRTRVSEKCQVLWCCRWWATVVTSKGLWNPAATEQGCTETAIWGQTYRFPRPSTLAAGPREGSQRMQPPLPPMSDRTGPQGPFSGLHQSCYPWVVKGEWSSGTLTV